MTEQNAPQQSAAKQSKKATKQRAKLPKAGKRNPEKMTIWEHLGELRRRITVIVVALLVATCILYVFAPYLIWFIIQPISDWLSSEPISSPDQLNQVLNVLDPLGGFTLRFKVSIFFAAIVTSPIWIWQMLAFFLPALNPKEKKWVLPTFFIAVFLFILGTVFCYLVILDPAFGWMLEQTAEFANVLANATEYVSLILLFEIAFGFAFELPIVIFYLIIFNIVPYAKLRKSWRIVYVVLLVFCAMVTPDASPVTMLLMFVAMSVLYEGSLLLSRLVLNKRIKENAAKAAAEEAQFARSDQPTAKTDDSSKDIEPATTNPVSPNPVATTNPASGNPPTNQDKPDA